jgi:hypothetical protein
MGVQHAKAPAACPKCKSPRTSVVAVTTNPPLQMVKCGACGHLFHRGAAASAT